MQAGKRDEAEQLSILDLAVAAASDCVWVSALATCSMNKNVAVWAWELVENQSGTLNMLKGNIYLFLFIYFSFVKIVFCPFLLLFILISSQHAAGLAQVNIKHITLPAFFAIYSSMHTVYAVYLKFFFLYNWLKFLMGSLMASFIFLRSTKLTQDIMNFSALSLQILWGDLIWRLDVLFCEEQ